VLFEEHGLAESVTGKEIISFQDFIINEKFEFSYDIESFPTAVPKELYHELD